MKGMMWLWLISPPLPVKASANNRLYARRFSRSFVNEGSCSQMKEVHAIWNGGRAVLNMSGRIVLTRYSRIVREQTK